MTFLSLQIVSLINYFLEFPKSNLSFKAAKIQFFQVDHLTLSPCSFKPKFPSIDKLTDSLIRIVAQNQCLSHSTTNQSQFQKRHC